MDRRNIMHRLSVALNGLDDTTITAILRVAERLAQMRRKEDRR